MTRRSATERELRDAIAGALLSTRRGWTTAGLALSRDRVLAAIEPIVRRELRRARGKTVGWCNRPRYDERRTGALVAVFPRVKPRGECRVVLDPRRKRGAR